MSIGTAGILSIFLNDDAEIRLVAPLVCLFVVMAASFVWGRTAAILGSVGATLTFATLLFPPIGRLQVDDPGERMVLLVFQVAAVGLAMLAPRKNPTASPPKKASASADIREGWQGAGVTQQFGSSSGTYPTSELHTLRQQPADSPTPKD